MIPSHIYYHVIEPYTRRPQPKNLLNDIIHFHATLEQVKHFYNQIIQERYNRDYEGTMIEKREFYDEFLEGLYIVGNWKYVDYYLYKQLNLVKRVCRQTWASSSIQDREQLIMYLQFMTLRNNRRPGDPI